MQGILLILIMIGTVVTIYFVSSRIRMGLFGKGAFLEHALSTTPWKDVQTSQKMAFSFIFIAIILIIIYLLK